MLEDFCCCPECVCNYRRMRDAIASVSVSESGAVIGCFITCPFCGAEAKHTPNPTMNDVRHTDDCIWAHVTKRIPE